MKTLFLLFIPALLFAHGYTDLSAFDQAINETKTQRATDTQINTIDSTNYESEEIDELIYIPVESPVYEAIDTIQRRIEGIKKHLSLDRHGKKLLNFDGTDQRRYLDYLWANKLLSQPAIHTLALDLLRLSEAELESAELVLSTQHSDTRASIFLHVKKLRSVRDATRSYIIYLNRK